MVLTFSRTSKLSFKLRLRSVLTRMWERVRNGKRAGICILLPEIKPQIGNLMLKHGGSGIMKKHSPSRPRTKAGRT